MASLSGLGLCPQTPVCDMVKLHWLTQCDSQVRHLHFLTISKPSPCSKILVNCQQATASDLSFFDIFAPQKVPLLKIPDDVIACDLWFAPPPNQKSLQRL